MANLFSYQEQVVIASAALRTVKLPAYQVILRFLDEVYQKHQVMLRI